VAKRKISDLLGTESAKSAALPKLYTVASDSSSEASFTLEQIFDRQGSDTRPLNPKHVEALAESIAVLGLIEPLAVDQKGRLLAGGHRRAAIAHLQETNPDAFAEKFPEGKIPVRVIPFDSEDQPDLALQIEIAENEQRRDYTAAEVRGIVDRLTQAGFVRKQGTLRKDEKPLVPALAAVIGKSYRQAQRYLAAVDNTIVDSQADKPIDTPHVRSSDEKLKRSLRTLQKWQSEQTTSFPDIERAIKLIEKTLKAIASNSQISE
jgi:ParB family transcriptional regulator, chromosome partitioning protein